MTNYINATRYRNQVILEVNGIKFLIIKIWFFEKKTEKIIEFF